MKKVLTLALALIMTISLVSCGNSTAVHDEPDKAADATSSETPAFDTSWASNDFEAMIPELPFKGWNAGEETDSSYELELEDLKTANGADTASGFEEDKDKLITYINSLTEYGFSVEETGENYKWLVTTKEGNTVEFMCADGFCRITFTKAS